MSISPTWTIALIASLGLAVIIAEAVRVDGRRHWLGRLAYLLAGALAGFLALAFPPAWPVIAFLATLLIGMALRDRRPKDVALATTGFGATWTLMLGLAILNELADPGVYGSPADVYWFAAGAVIAVVGLGMLLVALAVTEQP